MVIYEITFSSYLFTTFHGGSKVNIRTIDKDLLNAVLWVKSIQEKKTRAIMRVLFGSIILGVILGIQDNHS